MKNTIEISVNFSNRRPASYAWQAKSGIHSAYGKTQDEAVARLNDTITLYAGMEELLKGCGKISAEK